ncbi:MAG: D-amino acid aminotransferase [Gammaproteobacteria bacterium]
MSAHVGAHMSENTVYLNGEFLPIDKASVSVMDRGFLFGDGVYEVIPVYGRNRFRTHEHLLRLHNSLRLVSMKSPLSDDEWMRMLDTLLEQNPGEDRAIYLQITRGAYPVRDLGIKPDVSPTVFAMVIHVRPVSVDELEKGLRTITVDDFRWHACDIKSISLVANVMLRHRANEAEVADAILVRNGDVTEGTASNVFIVKNNVLITPPKSNHLLPGITRDLVLELAERNGINCEVRHISLGELEAADEVWLTGSIREIAPVVELNGKPVGNGHAGDMWRKMIAIYQQCKQELRNA